MGRQLAENWRAGATMMPAPHHEQNGRKAAPTAPRPEIARLYSKATWSYPFAGIGSTEYAARLIGKRCGLSPAVARMIVELGGIGGDA